MRRIPVLLVGLASLAACNSSPRTNGGPDTGLAVARSSRAKDSLIMLKDSLLGERQRQLTEQGQLIGDAATTARLVSEISRDLNKVRSLRVPGDTAKPESAMRTASDELVLVQKKVNAAVARLNASEARIRRMRSDSVSHASFDSTQAAQLHEYERSIADLRTTVEQQTAEIGMLRQQVDSVTRANLVLAAANDSITARNVAMEAHEDSVFVAIGTEKELASKGIVRREGGTLLLFGRGKTLVPGRALDPSVFQAISRTRDLTIQLPHPDRDYRIVSRQSLEFTDAAKPKDAIVRGALNITDPEHFWEPSRFLILVQK